MAGVGPAPKDPSRRARGNKDPIPTTTIRFVPGEQPPLPEGFPWHQRTVEWWAMWRDAPQAEHFMASDWDFLLDTAVLHTAMWEGNASAAAELRLRVAKFGQTPEDRARLRYSVATADEKDAKLARTSRTHESKRRYGDLRILPTVDASGS